MMIWPLIIIAGIYGIALIYCAFRGKRESAGDAQDFLLVRKGIGPVLGFLTFSATLFSTFTLMGMPDFFRQYGVASWIFLGVTDVALAFVALWFGLQLRKRFNSSNFRSVSDILRNAFGNKFASYVYLAGVFVFLAPYVAIQIRGIAIFLESVVPGSVATWIWAIGIMFLMLLYSMIGGLRAIMYSDAIQGIALLVVSWLIAYICLHNAGGIDTLVKEVGSREPALLSSPGPTGLLSTQFLVSSFIVIILMPISQPQLTIRLAAMRSTSNLRQMSVAVGLFAMLVILPTAAIGLYGAVNYGGVPTSQFLSGVLVSEQHPIVGSLAIVGLIAAAMSTADSQLFALGTEFEGVRDSKSGSTVIHVKWIISIFMALATAFALVSNDQLVLLARVSFAGTAMIAPMVLAAILRQERLGIEIPIISLGGLILFLLSTMGLLSQSLLGLRTDLAVFIFVAVGVSASVAVRAR